MSEPLHRASARLAVFHAVFGLVITVGALMPVFNGYLVYFWRVRDWNALTFYAGTTGIGLTFFARGVSGLWEAWRDRHLLDDEKDVPPMPIKLMEHLAKAFEFMPDPAAPGWKPFINPHGTRRWITLVDDKIMVAVSIAKDASGPRLVVGMHVERALDERVDAATALAILARFRNVGPFMDAGEIDRSVHAHRPRQRFWIALSLSTIAAWREKYAERAAARPKLTETVLDKWHVMVRRHLPERLPSDWSPPVALPGDDGLESGSWMFMADDLLVMALMVSDEGRTKLAVTVFSRDGEEVLNENDAMSVLRHFRGVREFVQVATGDDDAQRYRTFQGEVRELQRERLLN